jgi:hypothetical protein
LLPEYSGNSSFSKGRRGVEGLSYAEAVKIGLYQSRFVFGEVIGEFTV